MIKEIKKITTATPFEDGSNINKHYIDVVFNENDVIGSKTIRVKNDMSFEDIDFDNADSISDSMKQAAYDSYAVKVAGHLIDLEKITGEFNIHWDVDGDDIYDLDVCQFRDILNYMPLHERGDLSRELLENKGFSLEKNNGSDEDDDSSEQKIYLKYYDYSISEIEEFIKTLETVGIVKIPAGDGEFDTIMKGRDCFFINNVEFAGNSDEAVIYAISELRPLMGFNDLKRYLLELQEENEEYYEEAENEEINTGDDNMSEKFVEFELISKEDKRIYLKGNVNINTIDDSDGGDWEYEQNDGLLGTHIPSYWKVDGEDLTDEFKAFLDSIDWDMFRQSLWDYQDYEYFYTNFYENKIKIWGGA